MILTALTFAILLVIRTPIAIVLGISGILLLIVSGNMDMVINSSQRLFSSLESYSLLAIPLFMLAGEIMNTGGITKRLITFSQKFVGHFRGGLAYVNVVANTFLASIIGSAAAQIAMMSKVMISAMEKEGYRREFAAATTASAGILGPILPPSMLFIIYGATSGSSIGDMFLAGIIPGILISLGFVLLVAYIGYKESFPSKPKASWRDRGKSFLNIVPALLVPGVLIWGIVTGAFTPTESAGVACIIALVASFFFYKDINLKELPGIMVNTAISTAIVTLLIAMANIFGWAMTFERVPQAIAEWMTTVTSSPIIFLLLVNILFLILGMFIEGIALIIILTPIFVPILPMFGIDPILFGVLICLNVTIGILTPPVGSGLFLATSLGKVSIESFIKEVWPFVLVAIIILLLVTFIPQLTLWLPSFVE